MKLINWDEVLRNFSDEVGDCLEWHGSVRAKRDAAPVYSVSLGNRTKKVTVARALWLSAGRPLAADEVVYRACCNNRCVKLAHLAAGIQGKQHTRRADLGLTGHGEHTRAAMCVAARNRSTAVNAEQDIERVRVLLAAGGMRFRQIAAATGVHEKTVAAVAHGKRWQKMAPASSVFTWRPA